MKNSTVSHLGDAETIFLSIVYIISAGFGLFGNVAITLLVSTSKAHRRKFSGVLVLNLAIADFLVCFFTIPYNIFTLLTDSDQSYDEDISEYDNMCKIPIFFNFFTAVLRILSLTAMSIDRYLAINHPYLYTRYATSEAFKSQCGFIIGYVWFQSLVSIVPATIDNNFMIVYMGANARFCGVLWSQSNLVYVGIITTTNFIIPAVVIAATNFKVFCLARNQVIRQNINIRATSQGDISYTGSAGRRVFQSRQSEPDLSVTSDKRLRSFTRSSLVNDDIQLARECYDKNNILLHDRRRQIRQDECGSNRLVVSTVQLNRMTRSNELSERVYNLSPLHSRNSDSVLNEATKTSSKHRQTLQENCTQANVYPDINDCNIPTVRQSKYLTNCTIHGVARKTSAGAEENRDESVNNIQVAECNNNRLGNEQYKKELTPLSLTERSENDNASIEVSRGRSWSTKSESQRFQGTFSQADTSKLRKRSTRSSSERDIALSTLYLVVGYLISYLPFIISRLVVAISDTALSIETVAYTTLFTILDSILNPYIVLMTRKEFRRILKRKLGCGTEVAPELRLSRAKRSITGI